MDSIVFLFYSSQNDLCIVPMCTVSGIVPLVDIVFMFWTGEAYRIRCIHDC